MQLLQFLPAGARYRLRSLSTQWRAGAAALRGEPRPVFERRHSDEELRALSAESRRVAAEAGAGERGTVREVTVVAVDRSTADSVTLWLDNATAAPIRFRPGQFLTLAANVDGTEHRRQYSFCSDPESLDRVALTVRRVAGGIVSNHLVDHAAPGMRLRSVGPSGSFGTAARAGSARRVVLVAGGSGITPIWSIAQDLAAREPESEVLLIYANRGVSRVIFRREIQELADRTTGFSVRHVLERPSKQQAAVLGRLDRPTADATVPAWIDAEYFVCGPQPMMDAVEASLRARGVAASQVQTERFTSPLVDTAVEGTFTVHFARSGRSLLVEANDSLLEAGRRAGIPMDFSCTMGGCAACKVKVLSGRVYLPEPNCLSAAEAAAGETLACVARPRSELTLDA